MCQIFKTAWDEIMAALFGWKESGEGEDEISGIEFAEYLVKELEPNTEFLFLSDTRYKTWTMEQMKDFLKQDMLNQKKYVKEWFDCDDFTFELQARLTNHFPGGSHGFVWMEGHALNFFYCRDYDQIFLIEPQTDEIFEKKRDKRAHLIIA